MGNGNPAQADAKYSLFLDANHISPRGNESTGVVKVMIGGLAGADGILQGSPKIPLYTL